MLKIGFKSVVNVPYFVVFVVCVSDSIFIEESINNSTSH